MSVYSCPSDVRGLDSLARNLFTKDVAMTVFKPVFILKWKLGEGIIFLLVLVCA